MTIDQPADAGDSDKPSVPDDPEQLKQDIEQTREQLGETVEALVAKTDVKAQAKDKVGQLTGRVKGSTAQAKEQATAKVTQARDQLATKTQGVKQATTSNGAPAKEQLQARATAVGGKVRDVTPEFSPGSSSSRSGSWPRTRRKPRTRPTCRRAGAKY
jgi:chromosome segregation ATPase